MLDPERATIYPRGRTYAEGVRDGMQNVNSPWPKQANSDIYEPFDTTILAGDTDGFNCNPQNPERWVVSVGSQSGVAVRVYVGPSPIGRSVRLNGGGKCTIPADGGEISFRNVGTNTATVVAVAVRGYSWIDVDCGEVA